MSGVRGTHGVVFFLVAPRRTTQFVGYFAPAEAALRVEALCCGWSLKELASMTEQRCTAPLELWGGVECTVNRVGDAYYDQLARNGHELRFADLDRFAELGITSLRFPVIWERWQQKTASDTADQQARLHRCIALGMRPI